MPQLYTVYALIDNFIVKQIPVKFESIKDQILAKRSCFCTIKKSMKIIV